MAWRHVFGLASLAAFAPACGGDRMAASASVERPAPAATLPTAEESGPTETVGCRTEGALIDRVYVIDREGRVVEVQSSSESWSATEIRRYTYDAHGRIVREASANDGGRAGPEVVRTHLFEETGDRSLEERTLVGEHLARQTAWRYDEEGRPLSRTATLYPEPTPGEEDNPADNPIEAGPFSLVEQCEYDDAGRPARLRRVGPSRSILEFVYVGEARWPSVVKRTSPFRGSEFVVASTITVEGHTATQLELDSDGEVEHTVRWIGDCVELFFAPACSRRVAPPGPTPPTR